MAKGVGCGFAENRVATTAPCWTSRMTARMTAGLTDANDRMKLTMQSEWFHASDDGVREGKLTSAVCRTWEPQVFRRGFDENLLAHRQSPVKKRSARSLVFCSTGFILLVEPADWLGPEAAAVLMGRSAGTIPPAVSEALRRR